MGISVSRVGGDAQTKAMRQVAGRMKLELAQYRELAAFAQFASDLDKATRDQLERGGRLTELLKQAQYSPMSLGLEVAEIWAGTNGHLDKVPVAKVKEWEEGFARFLRADHKELLSSIETKKALDDDLLKQLEKAVKAFNRQFGVEGTEAADKTKDEAGEKTDGEDKDAKAEPAKAGAGAAETEGKAEEERRKSEERRQAERRSREADADRKEEERRQADRRAAPRRTTDGEAAPASDAKAAPATGAKSGGSASGASKQSSKPKAAATARRETTKRKR